MSSIDLSLVHPLPSGPVLALAVAVVAVVLLISRADAISKWLRGVMFLFRGIKIIDQAYSNVSE